MIKSRIAVAGALLAVAGAANAGTSVSAAWVSEYDWRGVPQNGGEEALQLSATYAADSGFYVGTWGSTLASGIELDVYAGYSGGDAEESFGYDVGVNYYAYPNLSDINFYELYAGISKGVFGAKLWYSPDFAGTDEGALYIEGNATIPLAEGFSLLAHVGYSDGDGIAAAYGEDSYVDWSAGIGYDVGNFSTFLKYSDGADNGLANKTFGRVIFGISTSLPWE